MPDHPDSVNVACGCGAYVQVVPGEYVPVICDDCLHVAADRAGYELVAKKKSPKKEPE